MDYLVVGLNCGWQFFPKSKKIFDVEQLAILFFEKIFFKACFEIPWAAGQAFRCYTAPVAHELNGSKRRCMGAAGAGVSATILAAKGFVGI